MFCKYCGAKLTEDENKFCPYCGKSLTNDNSSNNSKDNSNDDPYKHSSDYTSNNRNYYNYSQNNNYSQNDTGLAGWLILEFFIPLVGLILYFVFKSENRPNDAKMSITGAAISFGIAVFFYLLCFISCSAVLI